MRIWIECRRGLGTERIHMYYNNMYKKTVLWIFSPLLTFVLVVWEVCYTAYPYVTTRPKSLLTEINSLNDTGTFYNRMTTNTPTNGFRVHRSILSHRPTILIIAYMRTGSTLTASFLRESERSFYVFEPLHNLAQAFADAEKNTFDSVTLKYVAGTRNIPVSAKESMFMEELKSWLTCDLEKLSLASLTDDFHWAFTSIMRAFLNCVRHGKSRTSYTRHALFRYAGNTSPVFQLCLRKARQQCLASKTIVLKIIRLSIQQAITLLPFFPNMKIIHLVRDPRAIINSMQVVGESTIDFDAENLQIHICSRLQNDLSDTKFLMTFDPSIIKLVQYEDIAEHPVEAAKDLYAFAGLKFDDKIESFVKSQTQSISDGCNFCTQRRNSTVTSIKWRSRINFNETQFIFKSCKNSMKILGYLDLPDNQSLRDLSVSSRLRYNATKTLLGDDRF